MIYRIDDKFAWEGKYQERKELIKIYELLNSNNFSTLLLYKYKLPEEIGVRKWCLDKPENFDYLKIKEDCVMIYHLDIFINDHHRLQDLVDYCIENNKDLYIPITKSNTFFFKGRKERYDYYNKVLDNYESNYIELDDIEILSREIKLKSLLKNQ